MNLNGHNFLDFWPNLTFEGGGTHRRIMRIVCAYHNRPKTILGEKL